VLLFQVQRCICGSSARFSNPRLLLPQQCYFFKSNAAFTAAVLLFEIQDCFCRSSVAFSDSTLLLRLQCWLFEFNTANSPAALLLQIQPCGRLHGNSPDSD